MHVLSLLYTYEILIPLKNRGLAVGYRNPPDDVPGRGTPVDDGQLDNFEILSIAAMFRAAGVTLPLSSKG